MSLAHAAIRASDVAEILIVMLRTLAPAVTHVRYVQTDRRASTAVVTRADGTLALMLVLMTYTVKNTVTPHKDGKAVAGT